MRCIEEFSVEGLGDEVGGRRRGWQRRRQRVRRRRRRHRAQPLARGAHPLALHARLIYVHHWGRRAYSQKHTILTTFLDIRCYIPVWGTITYPMWLFFNL